MPIAMRRFALLTVAMMGLTTASAVATGAINGHTRAATVERWGPSLTALVHGRLWTLAAGDWLVYNQRHWLSMLLLLSLFALPLELLAGRRALATAFWLGSWGGTIVTAVLIWLLAGHLGWHPHPDLVHEPDIGGSAGTWGAAGALHVVLSRQSSELVWPLRLGSFLYLGARLVLVHGSADVAHLIAVGIGSAVAWRDWHSRA